MTEEKIPPEEGTDKLIKACLQHFPGDLASWLLGRTTTGVRAVDSEPEQE